MTSHSWIDDPSVLCVGWGTGSFFEHYQDWIPRPLEFIIDNNPDLWGQTVFDHPVKSPEALKALDPKTTHIVIFSSFYNAISQQLDSLGFHHHHFASDYYFSQIIQPHLKPQAPPPSEQSTPNAWVIQGPILTQANLLVIQYVTHRYPHDAVIVSTWDDTSPEYIDLIQKLTPHLILNSRPSFPGPQNINLQLASTYSGIKYAAQLGTAYTCKIRSDLAPIRTHLFDYFHQLWNDNHSTPHLDYGLNAPIIIAEHFTRKYLNYHTSDLITAGTTEDLLKFWSAPPNTCSVHFNDPNNFTMTCQEYALAKRPPEAYLGKSFAETINWTTQENILDSWKFYRDLFIIAPTDTLSLKWTKFPNIHKIDAHAGPIRDCITHDFWQTLHQIPEHTWPQHLALDPSKDLWSTWFDTHKIVV